MAEISEMQEAARAGALVPYNPELDGDDPKKYFVIIVPKGKHRGMWLRRVPTDRRKMQTIFEMVMGRRHVINSQMAEGEEPLPDINLQLATDEQWAMRLGLVMVGQAEKHLI